jgi:hypothetical protein
MDLTIKEDDGHGRRYLVRSQQWSTGGEKENIEEFETKDLRNRVTI